MALFGGTSKKKDVAKFDPNTKQYTITPESYGEALSERWKSTSLTDAANVIQYIKSNSDDAYIANSAMVSDIYKNYYEGSLVEVLVKEESGLKQHVGWLTPRSDWQAYGQLAKDKLKEEQRANKLAQILGSDQAFGHKVGGRKKQTYAFMTDEDVRAALGF